MKREQSANSRSLGYLSTRVQIPVTLLVNCD